MLSQNKLLKKGEVSKLASRIRRNLDTNKYSDEKPPEADTIADSLNKLFK